MKVTRVDARVDRQSAIRTPTTLQSNSMSEFAAGIATSPHVRLPTPHPPFEHTTRQIQTRDGSPSADLRAPLKSEEPEKGVDAPPRNLIRLSVTENALC